jgi:hypothetical protein
LALYFFLFIGKSNTAAWRDGTPEGKNITKQAFLKQKAALISERLFV